MDVFWAAFGGGAAAGVFTLLAVLLGEYIRWQLAQPKLEVSVSLGFFVHGGVAAEETRIVFTPAILGSTRER